MSFEVAKIILINSNKDLEMRGSGSQTKLRIPSETLEAINSLLPEIKARIIAKMSRAANDARLTDLKPKK